MQPIDLDAARSERWDVIIAGTSFAAMFFARELPPAARVLFLEKGQVHTHAERMAQADQFGAETFSMTNTSAHPKEWVAHSTFGGNSNCWWACTPRFHPDDFRLASRHGIGMDWPLAYDDLEEAYCDAEAVMDINGGGSDAILPRSRPFPSPPVRASQSDKALREHSDLWWAQPTARSTGTRRLPCCGNGVCDRCPIDSKFTILNGLDQFERPGFRYLTGAELRTIVRNAGTATHAHIRMADGAEAEIAADLFALGANAIFNAAILLRSGFTNPAIGRYLHEQASRHVIIDAPIENYFGGSSITGHGYHFYMGEHRASAAAVLVENWNAPPRIRPEPGKWTQRLDFKLLAEDLPSADNRVILDQNEPAIIWKGHDDYALRGLARAVENIADALPVTPESVIAEPYSLTEAHIQGTHRMALTAEDGVVDRTLRTFECRNVLALGAGAFPTCSPANPTLTLSALSAYAGRSL